MISNVSFTASFINSQTIGQKVCGKFEPCVASFVELDLNDKQDYQTAEQISSAWDDSFALCIFDEMETKSTKGKKHLYALTSQLDNFKSLDTDKVMGIAVVNEGQQKNELTLLQTNPDILAHHNYKNVGTAIVDSIKKLAVNKPIAVFSDSGAIGFYQKVGFKPQESIESHKFIWNA